MLEVVLAASLFVKANGEHVQVIERENHYSVMGVQMPKLEAAMCPQEKEVAQWARWRLRALLSHPSLHMSPTPCPDFQPTMERHCATVQINGESIVTVLLRENLAAPYVCTTTGCPKLHDWCAPREPIRKSIEEPPEPEKVPAMKPPTNVVKARSKPKAPVATAKASSPKQPVLVEVPQTRGYFPRTTPAPLPPALLPPRRGAL